MKLLTTANQKIAKGEKVGYFTAVLHLAPHTLSGFNVCPMASKGCAAACLNTAGRGVYDNVQNARIRKTQDFFNNRDAFMATLVADIKAHIRKAVREKMIPAIRLNGTSDIRWETVKVGTFANVMEMFPTIQFYDYTKIANRKTLPKNYHLTLSRSESNDATVTDALKSGGNVAVVFATKKGMSLPATWNGYTVVDGDITDLRFLDGKNVVVGLRGKGKARKGEHGGFVVTV